ncbi:MAG: hypothetical protein UV21_C0005G0093 [candidate division WWE3 bacterium GW2011_GWD2_42_34]|nr:MAG: hypothetical protein UV21_C0005G0093 [candidate division WWE3 bacterium GW2011_GWD2_42_34]KKT10423.1 MAG: hypothetical protein UV90_C0005G0070 [candidate division WWE3 bacterium GW2011_GWA2_43_24]
MAQARRCRAGAGRIASRRERVAESLRVRHGISACYYRGMKHILYHENNLKHPYAPQEDSYLHSTKEGIFVVADGVTHDPTDPTLYPMPSDSYEVARIVCNEVIKYLEGKEFTTDSIKSAYSEANKKVAEYNLHSPLYAERKNNGFTIGAAAASVVWIKENKLLYGVLDDCFISVFGDDLVDHPMLKSYVEMSAKYLDGNFDWGKIGTRRHWRENIRNHKVVIEGKEYGYGVIDGREGFDQYLQTGEVALNKGDLVCVYTDGFIKMFQDREFAKELKEKPFTAETYKFISETAIKLEQYKEKTGYFIKND